MKLTVAYYRKGSEMKKLTPTDSSKPVIQLGKLSANAVNLFTKRIADLDDKELRQQMIATKDRLTKYAAMTFTEGVMLGLECKEAYRRWGRTGGYQKFLDLVGVSQSKASRWQRIADAIGQGVLPALPPQGFSDDEEWNQATALEFLASPALPGQTVTETQSKGGKNKQRTHEAYMHQAIKLVEAIEAGLHEGEPVDGVVGYLLGKMRRLNAELTRVIDVELESQTGAGPADDSETRGKLAAVQAFSRKSATEE